MAAFIVAGFVAFSGQPGTDDAPSKIISYYSDSGHRERVGAGWVIALIGIFFFIWFLIALRERIRVISGDGFLAALTTVGGAVYATLTLVAFSINAALKTMSDDTFQDRVYPGIVIAGDQSWYVLHSAGGVGAAAMMIGASLAVLQAGALPPWLGWLGVLAGLTAIVSFLFIPWFVIAAWLVVAGVLVFLATPAPQDTRNVPA